MSDQRSAGELGIAEQVEKFLRAGLREAGGEVRGELEQFVRDFAAEAGRIAYRAEFGEGDDQRAAKISLECLREQGLTHGFIAAAKAQGVTAKHAKLIVGTVIRLLIAV